MRMKTIDPLDLTTITGKKIKFYGAMKINDGETDFSTIVITPVLIEILDGNQL
jgi:hypothetical protein